MNLCHGLCVQHIQNHVGGLLQVVVGLPRLYLLHQDDILLIHCCDKVLGLAGKQAPHRLQRVGIFLVLCLDNIDHPLYTGLNVKFFGPVVDVHQKQVVKKKVLNKVILVKALFVGYKKILDLERCQLPHHIRIIAAAFGQQNIFQLVLIKHLKELISLDHLTVCRRIYKNKDRVFIFFCIGKCGGQNLAFRVADTEIDSCYTFQAFNRCLKYLV